MDTGRTAVKVIASLGIWFIVAAPLTAGSVRAAIRDYHFEVEKLLPGGTAHVVRLVNHKTHKLQPGAEISGYALVGRGPVSTMTTRVTAVPIGNEGRYVTKIEPGMKVFELQLDAVIPGEFQTLHVTLGIDQLND